MLKQEGMSKRRIARELEQRVSHKILLKKSQQGDIASTREVAMLRKERELAGRKRTLQIQEKNLRKQSRRKNQPVT
jgi:hypothetical protein